MTVLTAATGHVAVASFSAFSTAWSIFPLPSASTSPAHGILSVGVAQNFIPGFFSFFWPHRVACGISIPRPEIIEHAP